MVNQLCQPKPPCKFGLFRRTNTRRPLHPPLLGGTISILGQPCRETFPLTPVSNVSERTTGPPSLGGLQVGQGSQARPAIAIRRRNLVHPAIQGIRARKASSVRLGQRPLVGP